MAKITGFFPLTLSVVLHGALACYFAMEYTAMQNALGSRGMSIYLNAPLAESNPFGNNMFQKLHEKAMGENGEGKAEDGAGLSNAKGSAKKKLVSQSISDLKKIKHTATAKKIEPASDKKNGGSDRTLINKERVEKSGTENYGTSAGDSAGSGTLQAFGSVSGPSFKKTSRPHFPEEARRLSISGRVKISLTLDAQGRVMSKKILESPHPVLSRAAMEAIDKSLFNPYTFNGKNQACNTVVSINFKLEE